MKRTLIGTVSSNSPDKTAVVTVRVRKTHQLYKKQYTATSKYMVHDQDNKCLVGDKVMITETSPISSKKRFELTKIIERPQISQDDQRIIGSTEEKQ